MYAFYDEWYNHDLEKLWDSTINETIINKEY